MRNSFKNLSNLLVIIFLAACGGGGGGSSSPQVSPPVPTPAPPPTYEFEGQIYWPLEFESAKVCIDFNLNNSCDSDEINQLSSGWIENGDFHKFKLTTQDTTIRDRINEGYDWYLVEINQQAGTLDQLTKLNHPSIKLINDLYGDLGINISPLSSLQIAKMGEDARSQATTWTSDSSFIRYRVIENNLQTNLLNIKKLIEKYDDERPFNIYTEPDSAYLCCATKERNNKLLDYFSKIEIVQESILDEIKTDLEEDETFQELQNNNSIGNISFSSGFFFPENVNRIFLSQNYPNDTTGSYTQLNSEQKFSLPLTLGLQAKFDIGNYGWEARVYSRNNLRVAVSDDELKMTKHTESCDIDPSYSCLISFNTRNIDQFSDNPFAKASYANFATNRIDFLKDTYRYYTTASNGEIYDCQNWEGPDRMTFNDDFYTYYYVDTELEAYYDSFDESCNSYSYPERQWIGAERYFADGDELVGYFYFDCAYRDPCSDYSNDYTSYQYWDTVSETLNSRTALPTQYSELWEGLIFSLDDVGDVIEVVLNEPEYSFYSLYFYPDRDSRGHELFLRSDAYTYAISYIGCNFKPSSGGYEPLFYYYNPSDSQIDEVISFCSTYLTRDFTFDTLEDLTSSSPFIRNQTIDEVQNENKNPLEVRSGNDLKNLNRLTIKPNKAQQQIHKTSKGSLAGLINRSFSPIENEHSVIDDL